MRSDVETEGVDTEGVGTEGVDTEFVDTELNDTELQPSTAERLDAVWADDRAEEYRDRWRHLQARFLDDPQAAAEEAERLAGEVLDSLAEALAGQKSGLDGWRSTDQRDTEQLRMTVRGYRDLLDRVLAL
jgi:hypothetical protein